MRTGTLFPLIRFLFLPVCLLLAMPAGATLALSGATLSPPGLPLAGSQDLSVDARISIIPSGAKTFTSGHSLQMETGLDGARWSTVVLVDGVPADRESGEGEVMFINGFVLSYPTNRDVALEVTVYGTVPGEEGPEITVLSVKELDNSGVPVPGSAVLVTEPVSIPTPIPGVTTPAPPPSPSPSPAPTRAGGGIWPAALASAGAVGLSRRRSG